MHGVVIDDDDDAVDVGQRCKAVGMTRSFQAKLDKNKVQMTCLCFRRVFEAQRLQIGTGWERPTNFTGISQGRS